MSDDKKIDIPMTKRSGILPIAVEMIGSMLRLPPGSKITAAHVDWTDNKTLLLMIEGDDMPEHQASQRPPTVSVIMHSERAPRGFPNPDDMVQRLTARWAHQPDDIEHRWVMRNWEPMQKISITRNEDGSTQIKGSGRL